MTAPFFFFLLFSQKKIPRLHNPPGRMNLNLTDAFGGCQEEPLVKRTLLYAFDPDRDLQAQLLERTDALVEDVWKVHDEAFGILQDDSAMLEARGTALDTVLACLQYVVGALLHPGSAKVLGAFHRSQTMFQCIPLLQQAFGPDVATQVPLALDGMWKRLLALMQYQSAHADDEAVADGGGGDEAAAEKELEAL